MSTRRFTYCTFWGNIQKYFAHPANKTAFVNMVENIKEKSLFVLQRYVNLLDRK